MTRMQSQQHHHHHQQQQQQQQQQQSRASQLPDLTSSKHTDTIQQAQEISTSFTILDKKRGPHKQSSRSSVQTQTSAASSSSGVSLSSDSSSTSSSGANTVDLPPIAPAFVSNSALVRQRANRRPISSVSDQLAAAAAQTGASLPLMIGNRSKCVVNLLGQDQQHEQQQQQWEQRMGPDQPPVVVTATAPVALGPQNTALRAEQRRQNMSVSVVRPVVAVASNPVPASALGSADTNKSSLLDDWMAFDLNKQPEARVALGGRVGFLEELLSLQEAENLASKQQMFTVGDCHRRDPQIRGSDQAMRQQAILLRREQHELARGVHRQHEFMVRTLEERRRHLAIILSVWAQRDFKHAIEKLVDIYQQGLIFTSTNMDGQQVVNSNGGGPATLKSLNTSLAVDVIGIIILRPRLWTLDICQLLLPIINQDLLLLVAGPGPGTGTPTQPGHRDYYAEIGLKALRLILTNFSSVIKSTLESLKDSGKLVGIDLSREDRINKCLTCYRLLLDSRSILATQTSNKSSGQCAASAPSTTNKLADQHRELQSMFSALFNSLQPLAPNILATRLQSPNGAVG